MLEATAATLLLTVLLLSHILSPYDLAFTQAEDICAFYYLSDFSDFRISDLPAFSDFSSFLMTSRFFFCKSRYHWIGINATLRLLIKMPR